MPTTPGRQAAELLAPAGNPDAGYAALAYGADAVYLGLERFSARAEADNFTAESLTEFAGYAHSLTPRRRVYLTLNTLVREDELPDVVRTLGVAARAGIDAVIVQDLGVLRIARTYFPDIRLHASTQMAVHSLDGVRAAADMGFSRVVLARELTAREVGTIAASSPVEIETFIHGTLCYSYSGLCLFSSMLTGRSGNRGRCLYSCREAAETPLGWLHPFSLKDLALGPLAADLAGMGVTSLKIEGRKKSPLYVAATVDYYRRILDQGLRPDEDQELRSRLQTIFARPWTSLFHDGPHNPDVADTQVVGHRGARIGTVDGTVRTPAGPGLRFRTMAALERHDGIQVDLPGEARPYGFPVDDLFVLDSHDRPASAFQADAGSEVLVPLPLDAPSLPAGLPVYQSSSQAVKRSYPFSRPKPGAFMDRTPLTVEVSITGRPDGQAEISARGRVPTAIRPYPSADGGAVDSELDSVSATVSSVVSGSPARDPDGAGRVAEKAFGRLGGSGFFLSTWTCDNPDGLAVRPGDWNRLRRDLQAALTEKRDQQFIKQIDDLITIVRQARDEPSGPSPSAEVMPVAGGPDVFRWSVFVEEAADLHAFTVEDLDAASEVVVTISPKETFPEQLAELASRLPGDRLRLALPVILRDEAAGRLRPRVRDLMEQGYRRWMVSGLGGLALCSQAGGEGLDIASDWALSCVNHMAAEELFSLGFTAATVSPEDEGENWRHLFRRYPDRLTAVVYSDVPLFISAACVHSLIGRCRRKCPVHTGGDCLEKEMPVHMENSGSVMVRSYQGGSVVYQTTPYSLSRNLVALKELGVRTCRVDLRWKRRQATEAVELWRLVRAGGVEGNIGNFTRGWRSGR